MKESTRNLVIGIVVVVVVVLVVGFLAVQQGGKSGQRRQAAVAGPASATTTQGIVAVPGTSAVATSGQVVTPQGQPVKLNVTPGSPEAPQESAPVAVKDLPSQAIKITAANGKYTPDTFTVKSGEPVVLSVTAGDNRTYVFAFSDAALQAVAVGVGPGETRAVTFNAPAPGKYTYVCNMPNCGLTGTMVVQ